MEHWGGNTDPSECMLICSLLDSSEESVRLEFGEFASTLDDVRWDEMAEAPLLDDVTSAEDES